MGNLGDVSPHHALDAAGLVASMRRLKELSGLTYRELEERAARNGDVLARSTLAGALHRTGLPRPEVLAAFVRACGDGARLAAWLEARERIATGAATGTTPETGTGTGTDTGTGTGTADLVAPVGAGVAPGVAPGAGDPPGVAPGDGHSDGHGHSAGPDAATVSGTAADADVATTGTHRSADAVPAARPPGTAPPPERASGGPRRRGRGRRVLVAAGLALPLLALLAWGLAPTGRDATGTPAAAASASRPPSDGWVTIRPARAPRLCLTDGRARSGAYESAVAVQRPCDRAPVPRTYLEPAGAGLYRIQWHHPQEGKGCLTVMTGGPVKGMLEPRNDCTQATLFRLEPRTADSPDDTDSGDGPGEADKAVSAGGAGRAEAYRLRSATTHRCIGFARNATGEGAEAVEERCSSASDQGFLIREG